MKAGVVRDQIPENRRGIKVGMLSKTMLWSLQRRQRCKHWGQVVAIAHPARRAVALLDASMGNAVDVE